MKMLVAFIAFATVSTTAVMWEGQGPGLFEMSGSLRSSCSGSTGGFACQKGVRSTHGGSTVFIKTR